MDEEQEKFEELARLCVKNNFSIAIGYDPHDKKWQAHTYDGAKQICQVIGIPKNRPLALLELVRIHTKFYLQNKETDK